MKQIIKFILNSYVALMTNYYLVLSKIIGYESVVFKLSLLPYRIGNDIRFKFYKKMLKSLGNNVLFSLGTVVTNRATMIGNNVRLGPFNTIGWANIGDDVIMAQHVHILSGSKQHSFSRRDIPIITQPGIVTCVKVAGDNWIGANVVIMSDIGAGTIIGSGSIVSSTIETMVVAAGNPCRVIKKRP